MAALLIVALVGTSVGATAAAPRKPRKGTPRPLPTAAPAAATAAPVAPVAPVASAPPSAPADKADPPPALPAPAAPAGSHPGTTEDAVAPRGRGSSSRDILHAALLVAPRVGLGLRSFGYVDRLTTSQRSYKTAGAPLVGIEAEIHPTAFFSGGAILDAVGLYGAYDRSIGLQSATSDGGQKIGTSWSSFDAGVRVRLPLPTERLSVSAEIGYGGESFTFDDSAAINPSDLAGVAYRFVRTGVDARLAVSIVSLRATVDYLFVRSGGSVSDRFPHAGIGGLDGRLSVGVLLGSHIELSTGLRYDRYFYHMNSVPGDAYVAGGALDEMARWETALGFYL